MMRTALFGIQRAGNIGSWPKWNHRGRLDSHGAKLTHICRKRQMQNSAGKKTSILEGKFVQAPQQGKIKAYQIIELLIMYIAPAACWRTGDSHTEVHLTKYMFFSKHPCYIHNHKWKVGRKQHWKNILECSSKSLLGLFQLWFHTKPLKESFPW